MRRKWIWGIGTFLLMLFFAVAGKDDASAATPTPSGWTMEVGESITITNGDLTNAQKWVKKWENSNSNVVKINWSANSSQCQVEAVGVGEAKLTVTTNAWNTIQLYDPYNKRWYNQMNEVGPQKHYYTIQVKAVQQEDTPADKKPGTKEPGRQEKDLTPTSLKLNVKSLMVEQGKTGKLTATISPTGAKGKVKWKSSNPKIASVNGKGRIKGKKKGKVTITARISSKIYAKCKVTVPIKPKKVSLDKKNLSIVMGQKGKLTYKFSPKKADGRVSWSSSSPNIVFVDQSGNLAAKTVGTAVVTVKTTHGKKATCKVAVLPPEPTAISLNAANMPLILGDVKKLSYTLSPAAAKSTVSFKSSSPDVASVGADGTVRALSKGSAVITAVTANGRSASCSVTVRGPYPTAIRLNNTELDMTYSRNGRKEEYQLTYELAPAQAEDQVVFFSSNSSIASVSQDGRVTAEMPGIATITADCGNGVMASCQVTVRGYVTELNIRREKCYVKKGDSQEIFYDVYPQLHRDKLTWTSSNPAVAVVSQEGVVTGKSAGTTTITVSSRDYTDSCELMVTNSEYVDITYGSLDIYENYYFYSGEKYFYNQREGLTVVQSGSGSSLKISNCFTGGDMHVTLAGVNLSNNIVLFANEGDIYLELMEGTHNYVTNYNDTVRGVLYCTAVDIGDGTVYITGTGTLEMKNDINSRASVIDVSRGAKLVISSGNIVANAYRTQHYAINVGAFSGLTILPEARVTLKSAGGKFLDVYSGSTANIAEGTLICTQDIW